MHNVTKENFFSTLKGKPFSVLQKISVLVATLGYLVFAFVAIIYPAGHEGRYLSLHSTLCFIAIVLLLVGLICTFIFSILRNKKKKAAYAYFKSHRNEIETKENLEANAADYRKMIKEYATVYGLFYPSKKGKVKSAFKYLTALYGVMIFVAFAAAIYCFMSTITFLNAGLNVQATIYAALTAAPIALFLVYIEIFIGRIGKQKAYFEKGSVRFVNGKIDIDADEKFLSWIQNEPNQSIYKFCTRMSNKNRFTYVYAFPSSAILVGIPLIVLIVFVFIILVIVDMILSSTGHKTVSNRLNSSTSDNSDSASGQSQGRIIFDGMRHVKIDNNYLIDLDTNREYRIYNYHSNTGYFEDENGNVYYFCMNNELLITGDYRRYGESEYEADNRIHSNVGFTR